MRICWTSERVASHDSKSRMGRGPSTTVAPYSSLFLRLDSKARIFFAVADCVDEMTLLLLLVQLSCRRVVGVNRFATSRPNDVKHVVVVVAQRMEIMEDAAEILTMVKSHFLKFSRDFCAAVKVKRAKQHLNLENIGFFQN